ncbi:MAG: ParA family protein [Chthonomonas sp.]|nr:ParA family protein [Chthonomonas sp.]
MTIWGVVNQKGGVGKTTTTVNLAHGLALKGQRVLAVDADPQGNATSGFGVEKTRVPHTLFDVFQAMIDEPDTTAAELQPAILNVRDNLDLIPATLDLAGAEPLLLNAVGKELILRDALATLEGRYDTVIIDGPPSLGILTINILAASHKLIVPMQCEFYALEGLSQLMKTIDVVRRRINPGLTIEKVVLTMVDSRNRLTQQVMEEVHKFFGDRVSSIHIPRNVRLSESPGFGESALERFPTSKGAVAYNQLAEEILEGCGAH